jgi:hypothetical protein
MVTTSKGRYVPEPELNAIPAEIPAPAPDIVVDEDPVVSALKSEIEAKNLIIRQKIAQIDALTRQLADLRRNQLDELPEIDPYEPGSNFY